MDATENRFFVVIRSMGADALKSALPEVGGARPKKWEHFEKRDVLGKTDWFALAPVAPRCDSNAPAPQAVQWCEQLLSYTHSKSRKFKFGGYIVFLDGDEIKKEGLTQANGGCLLVLLSKFFKSRPWSKITVLLCGSDELSEESIEAEIKKELRSRTEGAEDMGVYGPKSTDEVKARLNSAAKLDVELVPAVDALSCLRKSIESFGAKSKALKRVDDEEARRAWWEKFRIAAAGVTAGAALTAVGTAAGVAARRRLREYYARTRRKALGWPRRLVAP